MPLMFFVFATVLGFAITYLVGKKIIPYLISLKCGQHIKDIGPTWHQKKSGTPTMGGIMFIIGTLVTSFIGLILYSFLSNKFYPLHKEVPLVVIKIIAGLFMALGFGAIGFLDDYIKVVKKRNLGLKAREKMILQFLVAAAYLVVVYLAGVSYGGSNLTSTIIPFIGKVNIGWWYFPLSAVYIVGFCNAVNLNDGIDGLCGSVTFFVGLVFMLIAGLLGLGSLNVVSGALVGSMLGFLMFNFFPAKVFMGDIGSLFLGGIVVSFAFSADMPLILILAGSAYLLEMFSVILQVLYFKITHGKRIFKMSPFHHHLELSGYSENKICAVYSFGTILCGIAALAAVAFTKIH